MTAPIDAQRPHPHPMTKAEMRHSTGTVPQYAQATGGYRSQLMQKLDMCPVRQMKLSPRALIAVLKNFPEQPHLDLSGMEDLTDADLLEISRCCPQLESLKLNKCHGLSTAGIRTALKELGQLKSLGLAGATLQDANLSAICKYCPGLEKLDLSETGITNKGLLRLALPELQSLNVRGCQKLTTKGLRKFGKKAPELKRLHVSGCPRVDQVVLHRLMRDLRGEIDSETLCEQGLERSVRQGIGLEFPSSRSVWKV